MRCAPRILAWLATSALLTGCAARAVAKIGNALSGQDESILESDVAAPPDMENRHSTGIEQSGESLMGGQFTFRGHIEESSAFAQEIIERYRERGWELTRNEVEPNHGRLRFQKDQRVVDVDFRGNPLNPWMSQATVFVKRVGDSAAQTGGGGASGGPA
jgi:hypothetical protein